jgi:hypothetical protein
MDEPLSICEMQEKKHGLGEDSDPMLLYHDGKTVLGVFDGMGGAGGAECESDFGSGHTKAYVGSRIIKEAIEELINSEPSIVCNDSFVNILSETIKNRYAAEKKKFPPKSKGGLRSALIKEYPTTLAMLCVRRENCNYIIDSYWAGDSRNYIWTNDGLFQVSIDDLQGKLDPLQNLHEDAPMSNCIQADAPFTIHHKSIKDFSGNSKFIVLSATDGCFGYYPSPMDFERILYRTLRKSEDMDDWKSNLSKLFAYATGDDFSFSLAAFGYNQFSDIKKDLSHSNIQEYIYKRDEYENEVRKLNKLEEKISEKGKSLEFKITGMWPDYKKSYLKYMNDYEEG